VTAEVISKVNTYEQYQASEGVPKVTGFFVADLNAVDLAPWARKGGRGCFVNLEGTGGTNDGYVMEIAPGGHLNPQRQLFEETIFVLDGSGSTSVWNEDGERITFEWQKGSLFAVPINTWHQHFNGSGVRPARYFAVTNAPIIMNLFHNLDFIFNAPFTFDDRFDARGDFFTAEGKLYRDRAGALPQMLLETNFVPDVHTIQLHDLTGRGAGGSSVLFELASNTMCAHISEFPIGTYKKAHRHGPGAHVTILTGQGFSLLWPDGEEPRRVDWKPGSVVVPPDQWFHQHFNTGAEPARYLAMRWGSRRYALDMAFARSEGTDRSVKEGGSQIEYADENHRIHEMFEADLARSGAICRMRAMVDWCTAA
jgi:oxalate decarboxylase/phosphoglucose isomerase-like protein (cupin superfamily)